MATGVSSRQERWLVMSAEQRRGAVQAALLGWERDVSELDMQELVELVSRRHGDALADRFIETLSGGIRTGAAGPVSVAGFCVVKRELPKLERLLSVSVIAGATILTPAAWLNRLCTYTSGTGQQHTSSLYQMGLMCDGAADFARAVFELALKLQPEHPHLDEAMNTGGPVAAILVELVMTRRIGACPAHGDAGTPNLPGHAPAPAPVSARRRRTL